MHTCNITCEDPCPVAAQFSAHRVADLSDNQSKTAIERARFNLKRITELKVERDQLIENTVEWDVLVDHVSNAQEDYPEMGMDDRIAVSALERYISQYEKAKFIVDSGDEYAG